LTSNRFVSGRGGELDRGADASAKIPIKGLLFRESPRLVIGSLMVKRGMTKRDWRQNCPMERDSNFPSFKRRAPVRRLERSESGEAGREGRVMKKGGKTNGGTVA